MADYRKLTDAELQAAQQKLAMDPVYQQIIQNAQNRTGRYRIANMLGDVPQWNDLRLRGLLPEGYHIGLDGQLHDEGSMVKPLLAAGAVVGGVGALGAMGALGGGAAAGSGAGAGAGAAGATTATTASAGAGGLLPSTGIIGSTALPAGSAGITGASTGGGILSTVGGFLKNGKTSDILGAVGSGISSATNAAGQNRRDDAERDMRGNLYYENELMARSKQEADQRTNALKNVYRNSWYDNRQAGPNNTRGITPVNAQFAQTLDDLANQGAAKLGKTAQYDTDLMNPLKPYEPSKPGILERIGGYAGPVLGGLSTIGKIIGR